MSTSTYMSPAHILSTSSASDPDSANWLLLHSRRMSGGDQQDWLQKETTWQRCQCNLFSNHCMYVIARQGNSEGCNNFFMFKYERLHNSLQLRRTKLGVSVMLRSRWVTTYDHILKDLNLQMQLTTKINF